VTINLAKSKVNSTADNQYENECYVRRVRYQLS